MVILLRTILLITTSRVWLRYARPRNAEWAWRGGLCVLGHRGPQKGPLLIEQNVSIVGLEASESTREARILRWVEAGTQNPTPGILISSDGVMAVVLGTLPIASG